MALPGPSAPRSREAARFVPPLAAALALLAAAPAGSQTTVPLSNDTIPLSTDRAPVLMRFSTPSPPLEPASPGRARSPEDPPSGRIVNGGSLPLRVVVFLQRPIGFENGAVVVHGVEGGFRVEVGGTEARIGGSDRPIWCTGVVAPGSGADLEAWDVANPERVARLLAEGRVQIGILVAAPRGPVDAGLDAFAMPGPDAPGTAVGDLVFPYAGFLTGTHDLPRACFSTALTGLDACRSTSVNPRDTPHPDQERKP